MSRRRLSYTDSDAAVHERIRNNITRILKMDCGPRVKMMLINDAMTRGAKDLSTYVPKVPILQRLGSWITSYAKRRA